MHKANCPQVFLAAAGALLFGWGTAVCAAAATAPPMSGPRMIQLLDDTVGWYRTLGIQQSVATEPSDLLILYENRQIAGQVVALAFDIARANVDALSRQAGNASSPTSAAARNLVQLQNKFTAQATDAQSELNATQRDLGAARPAQKAQLQAKIAELQGEIDLINARKSLLGTMSTLASQSDSSDVSPSALKAQIEAMAVTMPAAGNAPGAPAAASGATAANATPSLMGASNPAAVRSGIWDLAANAIRLSEKISTITAIDKRNADLQVAFQSVSTPLIDQLTALSARGDTLAAQADTADSATLTQERDQLEALSSQFNQTSALLIPVSKVGVLLTQYRRNVGNWRESVKIQYRNALKTLGVRVAVLAGLLTVVFAAAELVGRAVIRYIQDTRRRYQLLLLRRIALWSLVFVIIGFFFASELGSIVTFAGLITAGLAVAMQSVLVSIVGYFFLIGKYGLRVGDRVQIGDVTGEVIDLGLVRLHLMELGAKGLLGPTGRIVAFPNSIVFQVSSGLFRQIHGVNFVWHELTLALPAGVDVAAAKAKLNDALKEALKDYREDILRQAKEIERTTVSNSMGEQQAHIQLSFTGAGVEAHVRYPVHLAHAAEIDERVSEALAAVVNGLASK